MRLIGAEAPEAAGGLREAGPEGLGLAVTDLTRRFGDFALESVTLRLRRGEYWALLGPSGCGKSLLLQTITGLFRPDAGTLSVAGRDVTNLPPERRGVALVFQRGALFPHYSVRGNIEYGLRAQRLSRRERRRRVDEVVAVIGLEGVLARPVATLSGGETQRVALARALAVRPSLLLLDEPLSLVDHNARLELQTALSSVHRELGLTTLHVTHSRDEALAMGDHLAVMLGGRVLQTGAVDAVRGAPRCPFVAHFLGVDPGLAVTSPSCGPACLAQPEQCHASDLTSAAGMPDTGETTPRA